MTLLWVFSLLAQPVLELPPDVDAVAAADAAADPDVDAAAVAADPAEASAFDLPRLGVGDVDENALMKGLQAARLSAGHTVLGGYAQMNATALAVGAADDGGAINDFDVSATLRRMVIFIAHTFNDDVRFYTELEWENALACRSCVGAVEIEQAFLEWDLMEAPQTSPAFTLRAGLVLIPIGILNQWHEPPVFHGVSRARLEEGLIPSTWRELGVGAFGELHPGLSYEAYVTTGLDALRAAPDGFGAGRGNGGLVDLNSVMASGRLELEPLLGFLAGVSAVYSETGGLPFADERFADAAGKAVRLTLPLIALEADARIRRGGLEARALMTSWHYPNAGDLMAARRRDGSPTINLPDASKGAVPEQMIGAQLEVAYDVLRPFAFTEQQLLPFARVEFIDTQLQVPKGFVADKSLKTKELTVGLSYRPLPQVVFKSDVQLRNRSVGPDEVQGSVGLGLMF